MGFRVIVGEESRGIEGERGWRGNSKKSEGRVVKVNRVKSQ